MAYAGICFAVCIVVFFLLDAKTSRSDGTYLPATHPYRKLMPFVMKSRNESLVYFDMAVPAENLNQFLKQREAIGITHCVVAAIAHVLHTYPSVNRFVSGGRLYQRNDVVISFSMKRQKMGEKAKIAIVRQVVDKNEPFIQICSNIDKKVALERSDAKTYADKEYSILTSVPRFVLRLGVWFVQQLDDFNILPKSFIDNDGLYCSAFVANVGSLGMPPGYHHLYEWGNCPIFITVGAMEERSVCIDNHVQVCTMIPLRIAFDERINDALGVKNAINALKDILSYPEQHLSDSSDRAV